MKNNLIKFSTVQLDPAIEERIRKRNSEINEKAERMAKLSAKQNKPLPVGDNLCHYTDELKGGYENLASEVLHQLQAGANYPEAKIDAEFFKEKDAALEIKITEHDHKNHNDEYELGKFNPGIILNRMWIAFVSTFVITIGEILFNTKAFQVTGENMLFAFLLSISISFAVFIFSHIVPFLYKAADTVFKKRLVLGVSLFIVTSLFTALAIFRSSYLATHDVHIQPFYFVIINLFFFIVSALLSFFVLPNWEEIKHNAVNLKLYHSVKKRKHEIECLKKEKELLKETISAMTKQRVRIIACANSCSDRFRKMYKESIAIFKRTNLSYRTDRKTPDCFSEVLQELDIQEVAPNMFTPNRKLQ